MASPRQMVVLTLKDLAKTVMRSQWRLRRVRFNAQLGIPDTEGEEKRLRLQIRLAKAKIDREIMTHADLLGLTVDSRQE